MLEIVIATRNPHKARELSALLDVPGIRWRSLADFPRLPSVAERGRTFDANAIRKARAAAKATGSLALADDSGIEVESLGWAPGVRSARFAGKQGDDRANNEKLLRALKGLPLSKRRARYRCSLALADSLQVIALARGTWSGRIAERMAGEGGFGYDPLFFLPRFGRTVGELPAGVKSRLSHRAQAARRLRGALKRLVRSQQGKGSRQPARATARR